jgi:hypothetical protein
LLLKKIILPGLGGSFHNPGGGYQRREAIDAHPSMIAAVPLLPGSKKLVGEHDMNISQAALLAGEQTRQQVHHFEAVIKNTEDSASGGGKPSFFIVYLPREGRKALVLLAGIPDLSPSHPLRQLGYHLLTLLFREGGEMKGDKAFPEHNLAPGEGGLDIMSKLGEIQSGGGRLSIEKNHPMSCHGKILSGVGK